MQNMPMLSLADLARVVLTAAFALSTVGCNREAAPETTMIVGVPNESDPRTVSFGPRSAFTELELKRALSVDYPSTVDKTSPREAESARYCQKVTCNECKCTDQGCVCSGCKCSN